MAVLGQKPRLHGGTLGVQTCNWVFDPLPVIFWSFILHESCSLGQNEEGPSGLVQNGGRWPELRSGDSFPAGSASQGFSGTYTEGGDLPWTL